LSTVSPGAATAVPVGKYVSVKIRRKTSPLATARDNPLLLDSGLDSDLNGMTIISSCFLFQRSVTVDYSSLTMFPNVTDE
jgi:hypothetical protein